MLAFQSTHSALFADVPSSQAAKLLKRLDENGDGELQFEEFAAWFTRTCQGIQRFRKQRAVKEKKKAKEAKQPKATPKKGGRKKKV